MINLSKLLLIIAFCIVNFSCKSGKNTVTSKTDTENSTTEEFSIEDVSQLFAKAVIDVNPSLLQAHFPDVSVARKLSPASTKGKNDKEVQDEMLVPLKKRFLQNLEKIQSAIEANDVDRAHFSYNTYKYYESEDPATVPRVLEVVFKNKEKDVQIPITVLSIDKKWYVFEILNTTNLFK